MEYKQSRSFRVLNIYERLMSGEYIKKANLAFEFGVCTKTIQRDIDDVRMYMNNDLSLGTGQKILYDGKEKAFYMQIDKVENFTNKEILVISKILLESRAFRKEELNELLAKLLINTPQVGRVWINRFIENEKYHYRELQHKKYLIDIVSKLARLIDKSSIIEFDYVRMDGKKTSQRISPLAIMFSEYYFYLIAYNDKRKDDFPIVFRIDRIDNIRDTEEQFIRPYTNRFEEGEFRNKILFMYSGELQLVKFQFSGKSIEVVLDRLPSARILAEENGVYTVEVEVYGNGIDMWLGSQGENVKKI